jgi:hypothetical protein
MRWIRIGLRRAHGTVALTAGNQTAFVTRGMYPHNGMRCSLSTSTACCVFPSEVFIASGFPAFAATIGFGVLVAWACGCRREIWVSLAAPDTCLGTDLNARHTHSILAHTLTRTRDHLRSRLNKHGVFGRETPDRGGAYDRRRSDGSYIH